MAQWYDYAIVQKTDGGIDREGNYYQPDANIAAPWEMPIVAIKSGVITSVQVTDWGQTVITQKFDVPLNSLATHMFFEHLSSSSVSIGQRVKPGDVLGKNGTAGVGILLGVGLYSGDVYGSGQAWQVLQNDLKPGGSHLLDPTGLIESLRNGTPIVPNSNTGNSSNILSETGSYLIENVLHLPADVVNTLDPNIAKLIGGIVLVSVVALIGFLFITLTGL